MATTFNVATLQTTFTANTDEVDAAVKRVKGEAEAVTKAPAVLEVGADTGEADKKLKDVQDLLKSVGREDIEPQVVVDALDAMADLEKLADELEDVDRKRAEAEIQADANEALDRAAKVYDTLQDIDDLDVEAEVHADTDRASKGVDGFKDEAGQSGREAAASFSGGFDDVSDTVQEIAANAFAGFGPIGSAAGTAAAGLGILFTRLEDVADLVNDAKEESGELALEFKEAGVGFDRSGLIEKFDEMLTKVTDVRSSWELWQAEAKTNLDDIQTGLEGTTVTLGDLYAAVGSGDFSNLEKHIDILREQNEALDEQYRALDPLLDAPVADKLADEYQARSRTIEVLQSQANTMRDAEEVSYQLREAETGLTEEQLRQADALDRVNDALRDMNDLRQSTIEATLSFEDGIASLTDKQNGWNNSLSTGDQMGRDNQRTILGLTDDPQALYDATLEQTDSQEQANAVLRDGRQRLIDSATAAGYTTSEVEALVDEVLSIPLSRGTDIYANTGDAVSGIRYVNQQLDLLDGRRVNVTVQYNAAGEQVTRVGFNSMRMAAGGTIPGPPCATAPLTIGAST
ncbi:hypothetical protein DBB34_06545 [Sphaerisporangium cinnabarinum]|nr:hypothetical protein [Sphaerisporangium cinnabarinum]PTU56966.1 hypothetical protein DBB34_06545 [Sphaerisporangium cinnabarinum]